MLHRQPLTIRLTLCGAGRVLRYLGLPTALSITPAAAGLLMACIALWPTPGSGAVRVQCGAVGGEPGSSRH